MIEPYWGELLVSPLPLELSLDACGHSCAYCFANLNHPARRVDVGRVLRLLAECRQRETFTAHLLAGGYPVEFSNKSDPFAPNNARNALALMQVMQESGVPVAPSTKGGAAAFEAAEFLSPSVWYISISSLSEDYRAAVEPGAPAIRERLRLMAFVRERGHRVMLGLNPCLPEWCPDPTALLKEAQAAGAESVWVEPLHLSARQEKNLTARQRAALTDAVIRRAKRTPAAPDVREHVLRAREEAQSLGMEVYTSGQPNRSDVWSSFREGYSKTFPTLQDWVNHWHAHGHAGQLVSFAEFAAFLLPGLPSGTWPIDSYLVASRHDPRAPKIPAQLSFRQLLWHLWQTPGQPACPANLACFAYAARDGEPVADAEGLPMMTWVPEGTDEYWVEVRDAGQGGAGILERQMAAGSRNCRAAGT